LSDDPATLRRSIIQLAEVAKDDELAAAHAALTGV